MHPPSLSLHSYPLSQINYGAKNIKGGAMNTNDLY